MAIDCSEDQYSICKLSLDEAPGFAPVSNHGVDVPSLDDIWNKISHHDGSTSVAVEEHDEGAGSLTGSLTQFGQGASSSTSTLTRLPPVRPWLKPSVPILPTKKNRKCHCSLTRSEEHMNPVTLVSALELIIEQLPSSSVELPHYQQVLGVQKRKRKLHLIKDRLSRRRKCHHSTVHHTMCETIRACPTGMHPNSS